MADKETTGGNCPVQEGQEIFSNVSLSTALNEKPLPLHVCVQPPYTGNQFMNNPVTAQLDQPYLTPAMPRPPLRGVASFSTSGLIPWMIFFFFLDTLKSACHSCCMSHLPGVTPDTLASCCSCCPSGASDSIQLLYNAAYNSWPSYYQRSIALKLHR